MQRKPQHALVQLPGMVLYLDGSSPTIDLQSVNHFIVSKGLTRLACTSSFYQALAIALSYAATEEAQAAVFERATGIFPRIVDLIESTVQQTTHSVDQEAGSEHKTILAQVSNLLDLCRAFTNSSEVQQTSETCLRRLIGSALEGICELDKEDRIVFVNSLLAAMLGYTTDQMIGRSVYDFFYDRNVHLAKQHIMENRHEVTRLDHMRLRHRDGQSVWALISVMPMLDCRGEYAGALGIVTDVTGHKRYDDVKAIVFQIMQAAEFLDTPRLYYELVYRAIRNLLPISRFELVLYESRSQKIHFAYVSGEDCPTPTTCRLGHGLIEYVLRTGLVLVASPQEIERLLKSGDLDPAHTYPLHWVGVPLKARGRMVGVITLQLDTEVIPIGSQEIGALEFIATHVSANIERIRADERLRDSEAAYRAMFEKNRAVKLLIDPRTGKIVEANPAACEFYGYSARALRGMRIMEINTLPPDQVQVEMSRALHAEQTYFLFKHRLASGEIRDVEVYSSPMKIHGRRLLFSVIHDITSRRKAENDLHFRLQLGKMLARVSTDFVAASPMNLNPEIVRALQVVGTFLGADFACVLQVEPGGNRFSSTHIWSAEGVYTDLDVFQELPIDPFAGWMNMLGRGDVVCVQHAADMPPEAEHAKRLILDLGIQSFICVPLFQLNVPIGWVGFFSKSYMRDWSEGDLDALRMLAQIFMNALERRRTELAIRQHEQELQTLIENSPDVICRFDGEMRCLYVSSQFAGFINTTAEDMVGRRLDELNMPDKEKALLEATARQVFVTGQPATVVVAIPSSPETGALCYFQIRIAAVLGLNGGGESVLCVARDITELECAKQEIEALNRSLERRVVERTKQLEVANRHLELEIAQHEQHKAELISSRAHLRSLAQQVVAAQEAERQRISRILHDEVTQDLMALTMTLAWMQNELPEDATELLRRLDAGILSIEMTTEQIRQLAHDLRPPALDALGLDRALESYCKVLAERMSMHIEYAGASLPRLPGTVSICLYRAAQEGLTNIVKHAQARHIWVRLLFGSRGIVLTIRDDGQGFDPAALQRRMSTQAVPWGVGLRGMRERFELLGGKLSIHSSLHVGTRLTGFIPGNMIKELME